MQEDNKKADSFSLECEALEPRVMLSSVQLFAAGFEGTEQIQLKVDNEVVASFSLNAGAENGDFETFVYNSETTISADQVKVEFINDEYDPAAGIDSNVRLDAIAIDGVRFETEDKSVYSTGTYLDIDGIQPGYRESEVLHSNGYFKFAEKAVEPPVETKSVVHLHAAGFEGTEQIRLLVDDIEVATYSLNDGAEQDNFEKFTYNSATEVTADQIKVEFINDEYDPAAGIDSNVRLDAIEIDGERFETEDKSVYSTGTYKEADGTQPGYRESEVLHSNGYFKFAKKAIEPPVETKSVVHLHAAGFEGTEQIRLLVDDIEVATYSLNDGAEQGNFEKFTYNSATEVTADQIKVEFINDEYDPAAGIDSNVRLDAIEIDGERFETEDKSVYSTGTYKEADGTQPGYRESEVLHSNGYFKFAKKEVVEPKPGVISLVASTASVNENAGTVTVQLLRSGGSDGEVAINYQTVDGSAVAGRDYVASSGTVVFAERETTAEIVISLIDDSYIESAEDFSIEISSPTNGATLGSVVSSKISVQSEDEEVVPEAGPELVVNGSFEENTVASNSVEFIAAHQVPGWSSKYGQDIELWGNGFDQVAAPGGNNFIELDNGLPQDGIYQDVQTEEGRFYQLTFSVRSRGTDFNSDNEAVVVEWNGVKTNVIGYRAKAAHEWTTISVIVRGTGGQDRLLLRESVSPNASNGLGPLLDNVSLKAVGATFVSAELLHGADGTVAGDTPYYFHNVDENGSYVYGYQPLVDDEYVAYELSQSDVDFLEKQARLGVVAASDLADVSDARGIRELDGFGNNVQNPLWGNADQVYARLVEANYANGVDELRDGPNPREISNAILNQNRLGLTNLFGPDAGDQDRDLPNGFRGSEFVPAFGQYFDHGLGFLPKGGVNSDGTAAGRLTDIGTPDFPLSLTRGDVEPGTGIDSPRQHPNQTSPFIDQNQAYGSNDKVLEFLLERDYDGTFTGRLFAGPGGGLPNLGELKENWQRGVDAGLAEAIDWDSPTALSNFRGSGDPILIDINPGVDIDLHLVAGDGRVNENAGLSVVHEIWHNNHNFWVGELLTHFNENGGIPSDLTSEHIFQMAKIINEGEYQRAVFDEFVELLVGSDVHSFKDYNPNINADLTHEFAAAAYRLGHSMLNNYITVRVDGADNVDFSNDDTVEVPLFDLFLNPTKYRELGAADIMAGMTTSLHQEIDAKLVTTLRNNLVGRPADLGSFNIARGRELGLPTLNEMREAVGLSRYSDWSSFGNNLRDSADLEKFQQVYSSVDEIDLWVGGLAEKVSSSNGFGTELAVNSVMGETFAQVFSVQMIGLQDGDRFYYKHRLFETNLRQNMQSQDFADIVERTLGLEYLQADILKTVDNRFDYRDIDQTQLTLDGTSQHDVIIARNIGETINAGEGDDTIHAKAGDDIVYGEDGDDALHGGAGNDQLIGGDGDDRADGGTGDDIILAGKGDDDISGNDGNDFMDGGLDNDELFGGRGDDKLYGSEGNDNVWGGLDNDLVDGGSGDDNLSGNEGDDIVIGGDGNDIVIGGDGEDALSGGSGGDEFWFLPNSGHDVISDFNVSEDRIDLHRYVWEFGSEYINLETLKANAKNVAGGTMLYLPGDSGNQANSILIEGVSKSELFANGSEVFILKDRVFERENLILTPDNVVLDAGSSTGTLTLTIDSQAGAQNGAVLVEVRSADGAVRTETVTDNYDANVGKTFTVSLESGDTIRVGITAYGVANWSDVSSDARANQVDEETVVLSFEDENGTDFDDVVITAVIEGNVTLLTPNSNEAIADGNIVHLRNVGYGNAFLANHSGSSLRTQTTEGSSTRWKLIDANQDGKFLIKNVETGRYLDGDSGRVDSNLFSLGNDKLWEFVEVEPGKYHLKNVHHDRILDANVDASVGWDPGASETDDLWTVTIA